jgi:hypothetical protein
MSAAPDQSYRRAIDKVVAGIAEPQLRLLCDRSRWRVAVCSRQAGKNWAITRLLILRALERADSVVVYCNDTFRNARDVMWTDPRDGLPVVLRELGIPHEPNETRMEVRLGNGSLIQLVGADRQGGWDQLRGRKLDLIVADEMQRYEDAGLAYALGNVVPDCLAARGGSFVGIGTPDIFCAGTFHDLCERTPPGWTVHRWTARDLDGITPVWREQLRWKAEHGIADDDPRWLRDKLGLWVRDDSKLILPLVERSLWDGTVPDSVPARGGLMHVPRSQPLRAFAGVDFGFTDATAVCVGSISREEGVLRELHTEEASGLNTAQVADMLRRCMEAHGVERFYGDAAAAQTIEDLRTLYRLPVVAVEKHDKALWIQEMAAHLLDGRLRIRRGGPLHDELLRLSPDPERLLQRKLEPRTGAGGTDHQFDALRYLYRGVWTNEVRSPEPPLTDAQRMEADRLRHREERLGLRRPRPERRWDR